MSLQSNKRSQTKSSSARRKDIYKKSKYYQEKRQKLLIATGIGIFVLVFILILAGIRGCSNYMSSRQAAAKKTVSMNASKDNSQKASSDSQNTDSSNATVSSPVSLTLSVVGDCTLGTDETFDYDTSLNAYYENYGADYFLQNVKDIFSTDDLTIANFEGTLTDSDEREDKTFAFKAPASYASILTGGSVEAVNTANNHSHDYGEQSFDDTLAALDDAGIVHFGYDETAVMDVKGIKVGLVGIYELYDHLEREQQLKDNIAKVKADGAQLIVVIFHWGNDMDTMIYQQTFTIDADGIKKDNVTNIIPCSISSAAYDGYNNYQPTPAEGDEATRILGKINERSSWISTAEGSTFTAKYNSNNDSQSSSADTAASDSDIVDMNSSASDDTDAETYDESYDTDNSDAE